jgi:hypothetical protein
MIRTALLSCALVAGVAAAPAVTLAAPVSSASEQARPATAADAAPFVGDWTLTLQGPNGPATFDLSVKVEGEKVLGEISSEVLPKQPIADITIADKSLVLGYSFQWEGNPVATVVSLTPAAEGKTTAQIDFAGGAYVMTGTAAKKDKAK